MEETLPLQVDILSLPDVTQATHDNLNVNANIQMGDADVTTSNPVLVRLTDGVDGTIDLKDGVDNGGDNDAGLQLAGRDSGGIGRTITATTAGRLQVEALIASGGATPLPDGASTLTEQQTQSTTLSAIQTALQIMDDWDESDRAKVNLIAGQAGITAGAGVVSTNTPRLTLASDDPAVVALQIIDDWDETDRAKVNPVVGQAGLAAGTGVDASNALRVSLATNIPLPAGTNRIGEIRLVDINDLNMDVAPDVAVPANTRALCFAGHDDGDVVRIPTINVDALDGKKRVSIEGKISVSPPEPPAAATPVSIAADSPLDVTGTDDTDTEITTGDTFTIQQVTAGAEGDPTEKGAVIRVSYIDGSSVEHVIEQIYLTGQTVQIFPDTSTARDGTTLLGVAGAGLGVIRIRREQFGGGTRELDVVLRGFEQ